MVSNGELIDQAASPYVGGSYKTYQLQAAAVAISDGVWVDMRFFRNHSIHVSGTFVGTVVICGSDDLVQPLNTDHGTAMGTPITAPDFIRVDMPIRWVKARVTAWTSGAIGAILHGVAP